MVQCAIGIVFSGAMFWMFGYGIVMGDSHLGTPFYGLGDVSCTELINLPSRHCDVFHPQDVSNLIFSSSFRRRSWLTALARLFSSSFCRYEKMHAAYIYA